MQIADGGYAAIGQPVFDSMNNFAKSAAAGATGFTRRLKGAKNASRRRWVISATRRDELGPNDIKPFGRAWADRQESGSR